jgi:hypothetical protein
MYADESRKPGKTDHQCNEQCMPAAHVAQCKYLQNNQTGGIFRTARKKLQQHKNCQHIAIDLYQNVLFWLKRL